MSQESDQNLCDHLQERERREADQYRMTMIMPDDSVETPDDILAYPTELLCAETPHVASYSDPEGFRQHLRKMSGQVAEPLYRWEKDELSGGLVSVINPAATETEVDISGYLEEQLTKEGSILGRPHGWMLAYLPAGPYTESGLHVTLIANPRIFNEKGRQIPLGFDDLDQVEQTEFLDTTETIFHWLRAKFPDETFAMNVNRGWPKWDEDVEATPQTIQSIHAQIFALPKRQLFKEAYVLNPDSTEDQLRNKKIMALRLTRDVLSVHNVLMEFLSNKLPEFHIDNRGDAVCVNLGSGNWGQADNCKLIAAITREAQEVLWIDRTIAKSISCGYSWCIDSDNAFRIAFSDNGGSSEALYHTVIMRGSQDPLIKQRVKQGQDELRVTLPEMLSEM